MRLPGWDDGRTGTVRPRQRLNITDDDGQHKQPGFDQPRRGAPGEGEVEGAGPPTRMGVLHSRHMTTLLRSCSSTSMNLRQRGLGHCTAKTWPVPVGFMAPLKVVSGEWRGSLAARGGGGGWAPRVNP